MILAIDEEWQPFVSIAVGDPSMQHRSLTGKGYARYAPTTEKLLTDAPAAGVALPASARHALISILTNPIRFRTDATAVTASEGTYIAAGTILRVSNSRAFLEAFRFIDTAAGASEVTVAYFRRP